MSDLDHRVGVSEANLVVRHLKLVGITEDNIEAIIAGIDGTFGIDAVSFEDAKSTLHIGYDATHCNLDGIETIIRDNGADISDDFWTKMKEGYYQFVDENDNPIFKSDSKPVDGQITGKDYIDIISVMG